MHVIDSNQSDDSFHDFYMIDVKDFSLAKFTLYVSRLAQYTTLQKPLKYMYQI